jgi:hypothetical protein
MLRNVALVLPDGNELIAGLRPNNMYFYYGVVQAIMIADVHSFKLVLNVPFKTANRQYELSKWSYYLRVFLITRVLNLR